MKNNKGFSLVELIIVIAIMAVLIGVLAPQYLGYVKKSKVSTDLQNAQQMASKIAVKITDEEVTGTKNTDLPDPDTNKDADSAKEIDPSLIDQDTLPTIQVDSTYKWKMYIKNNTVHIIVVDSADVIKGELYPTVTPDSDWDK